MRPETSYQVSNIRSRITEATISDIKETKKIIKLVRANKGFITFHHFASLAQQLNASFNKFPDGSSQGGHFVFLADKNNNSCLVSSSLTRSQMHVKCRNIFLRWQQYSIFQRTHARFRNSYSIITDQSLHI